MGLNYVGLFFMLSFLIVCNTVRATEYQIESCNIKFKTTGKPVLVDIVGKSNSPCYGSVTLEKDQIVKSDLKMKLDKIDTGIELRNKHLRENYLKIDQNPESTLEIKTIENVLEQLSGKLESDSKFTAEMQLAGKKSEVSGFYKIKKNIVEAKMDIDFKDFGVPTPSFMGVKIVDKIHLTINFEIKGQ